MAHASMFAAPPTVPEQQAADDATAAADNDPKMMLLRLMIEIMTGFKIHVMSVGDIAGAAPMLDTSTLPSPDTSQQPAPPPAGFGIERPGITRHQLLDFDALLERHLRLAHFRSPQAKTRCGAGRPRHNASAAIAPTAPVPIAHHAGAVRSPVSAIAAVMIIGLSPPNTAPTRL